MERHREKVLNTRTEIYLILRTKAFVGNDSFKMPPVCRMHCSGVILTHSSTESSNLECSVGLFYELWSLVLIFYWIQVRWLAGHSSSFTFFSFHGCVWDHCLAEMPILISSSSSWYMAEHFYQEYLGSFFYSSFLQLYEFCQCYTWKFWGDVQCHLTSKHGVNYGIQRIQFLSHLTRLYSPSISQACLNVVQPTLNELQHAFSSAIESCVVSVHTGHGGWVHYLSFSLKQLYMLIPGLSEALHKLFLDNSSDNSFHSSVRNLVRSTGWWPVYGEIMFFPLPDYGPSSAHWNIQKYRNPSVTNAISMFCNNKVAKVLRKLFAFTHHEMFLVWHVGNETPFYRPSVGTEPANINFHWQGARLLSNNW